jgi:hypothetical protein
MTFPFSALTRHPNFGTSLPRPSRAQAMANRGNSTILAGMDDPFQPPPTLRESCRQVDTGIEFVLTTAQQTEGYDRLHRSSWKTLLILLPVILVIPLQGFLSPKGFDPKSYIPMAFVSVFFIIPFFVFLMRGNRRRALAQIAKNLQDTMLVEMTEQYFRLSCDTHMHKRPWTDVKKVQRSHSVILLILQDGTADMLPRHTLVEDLLARFCPLPISG